MKRYAVRMMVAWASVLMLVPVALAQDVPFQGIVVQNGTPVRAGAGRAYYVVGELEQGAVVRVDEVIFGWNKIVPPDGVYSYVSKAFVDRRGNGEVGFVNQDRTEVRAGSLKGPGESYRTQQPLLNKGDRVEILGEEGAFFKIRPPEGAYVFIGPGSVRRAAAGEVAPPPRPAPAGTAPAPDTAVTPEAEAPATAPRTEQTTVTVEPEPEPDMAAVEPDTAVTDPAGAAATTTAESLPGSEPEPTPGSEAATASGEESPAADADPAATAIAAASDTNVATQEQRDQLDAMVESGGAQSAAVSDKLKELEGRMLPEFTKPLEEQPIAEMIREYEAIGRQPLPAVDRQIVRMRLAALQKNQRIAETLRSIHEARENLTPIEEVQEVLSEGRIHYDAIGRLQASSVYNGQNLPLRFRLIDPASGRTLVWVQPGTLVEPRRHLGRVVGLVGGQEYDPGVKTNVLTVTRIDILEPTAEQPEPTATP